VLSSNPGECAVFDASGDGRAAASDFTARTLNVADINHDGHVDLIYGSACQVFVQTGLD
jgi:pectin methylesterase-like acyl-CoA thioesterase